ncbi:MAG: hypothetical protein SPJ32_04780, partial [Oscillospiraceae bacterium]|nr:hypothetical protein [Oscillospiraceae bacterium]
GKRLGSHDLFQDFSTSHVYHLGFIIRIKRFIEIDLFIFCGYFSTHPALAAAGISLAPGTHGHARKSSAEKLNSFSSYFTHKLGRKITVEYLIGKESESQTNADIPKGIPLTMYDEAADTESSNNIKTTVVTYSRVAQDINDPVLRKIVNTCLESPEYIQPLSIMLDQLIKMSEVKNDTESKNS